MLRFRSREKYYKWKAERLKGLSQSENENAGGKAFKAEKDGFKACCFECGKEISVSSNFCPHCGSSLKEQNESGYELQNENIFRKFLSGIRNKFSSGFLRYRLKRLIRTAILCIIAYSVISLFFGGKPIRKLNEKMYDLFTYAAEKSENNHHESLKALFLSIREDICSIVDYMACQSDELGIADRYITSKKQEKEKQGEQLAEELKRMQKLREGDSEQQ